MKTTEQKKQTADVDMQSLSQREERLLANARAISPALVLLCLLGCGDSSNAQGVIKTELLLMNDAKEIQGFSLGRQSTLMNCLELLEDEIRSHARDSRGLFYTTEDFSYGGYRTDKINVEHQIVGARCLLDDDGLGASRPPH